MNANKQDTEEIEMPAPCASCSVEPICFSDGLSAHCEHRELRSEYVMKVMSKEE